MHDSLRQTSASSEGTIVYAGKSYLPCIIFFDTEIIKSKYCIEAKFGRWQKSVGRIEFTCEERVLKVEWLCTKWYHKSLHGVGTALMEAAMKVAYSKMGPNFNLKLLALLTAPLFYYTLGLKAVEKEDDDDIMPYTSRKYIKKNGEPIDFEGIEMELEDDIRDCWIKRILRATF